MSAAIKNNQAGFSIIEVVMSLLIVGIVFLVYNTAANTLVLNRNMKNQELAFRIASAEIDTVRAGGYANIPATGAVTDTQLALLPGAATETLTVTTYDTRTKQVQATVAWFEPGNPVQHTATLTTLVTQGGIGQ